MPPIGGWKTGVYAIRHMESGKLYVGSAAHSFSNRFSKHRGLLSKGKHPNKHLQAAWSLYGASAFEFLILEGVPPAKCLEREQYWIDLHDVTNREKGYNKSPDATGVLGIKWSAASREKAAVAHRGKKLSAETVAKRTAKQKGIKRSEATKKRMSASAKLGAFSIIRQLRTHNRSKQDASS